MENSLTWTVKSERQEQKRLIRLMIGGEGDTVVTRVANRHVLAGTLRI